MHATSDVHVLNPLVDAAAARACACRLPASWRLRAPSRSSLYSCEEYSMVLLERYRAAVERNEFSVFLFWRGLW